MIVVANVYANIKKKTNNKYSSIILNCLVYNKIFETNFFFSLWGTICIIIGINIDICTNQKKASTML